MKIITSVVYVLFSILLWPLLLFLQLTEVVAVRKIMAWTLAAMGIASLLYGFVYPIIILAIN